MANPSPIIVVERALLKSQAFRCLSSTSKDVYFDFRMKCKMDKTKPKQGRASQLVILNNGELEYCYSTAEKNGIPRRSFRNAIDDLIQNGFIDITHIGMGGHKGDKNKYAISDRWKVWGTDAFINKDRSKDTRQGRGWAVYNRKKSANIGDKIVTPSSDKIVTPREINGNLGVTKMSLEKIG